MLKQAKAIKAWGVQQRRYLHQHPEISMQEKATAQYCKTIFNELGYTVKDCFGYGFIADLDVPNTKKKIAFRADMDALPIQEENSHDFVSKNPGVAHMCGHDVHMAIALTTAKLLKANIDQLPCSIRFIFQPSEEELPGGALGMIENGCLENVTEIYGLHNHPLLPVNQVATRVGSLTAGASTFEIKIIGKGCHAAQPQEGLNPIPGAAFLINAWQAIPKQINPQQPPILTIATCHGGTAVNIIPDSVQLSGTIRILEPRYRDEIKSLMEAAIKQIEQQGYRCEFKYNLGYDCVVNDAYGVKRVIDAAKEIVPEHNIQDNIDPAMFAEDFCYYLQKIPGNFFLLGSSNKAKNITEALHSAHFDVDEDVIPGGAAIMAEIALQTKR